MNIERKKLASIVILFCMSFLAGSTQAEEINVAVASNFISPMKAIVSEFEKSTGHKIRLSHGSSGKIFAQIKHGAPFDVFFSADQLKPDALEKENFVVAGSRFTYAIGAIALWSKRPEGSASILARLKSGDFNKLALANPKLAPYGLAAVEVLDNLKLKQATVSKWVRGENIAQTYQFVGTGNAELGFVALSQIMVDGQVNKGSSWVVPDKYYHPIRQDAVLLKRGENSEAAREFIRFFRGEKVRGIVVSYGYKGG